MEKKAAVSNREVDMALQLVKEMSEPFAPKKYKDTYRDDLLNDEEIEANSRARSAKLRAAVRTEVPARAADPSIFGLPNLPEIQLPAAR